MRSRISLGTGCAVFLAGLCMVAALGGVRGTQDLIIATPVGGSVDDAPSGGEIPAPAPATVSTNQYDYAPGTNVGISGSAFAAGGNVTLTISHLSRICTCGPDAHRSWTVAADSGGTFNSSWALPPTATGPDVLMLVAVAADGTRAETMFTSNLTGAIWTTDQCGATVNHNVYGSCEPPNPLVCDPKSPFLNGGPQNQNCGFAGGLPDDDYYFQVTDPSGMVLLSNDGIEHRQVHVECGVITQYANLPGSVASHVVGTGFCPAHDGCAASISLALWPFDATPNPGGEYKCWVTRVSDYDEGDPQANFGFRESESKTDNYKCARSPGTGACCLACPMDPDNFAYTCLAGETEANCQLLGGAYQGDDSICNSPQCGTCSSCNTVCADPATVECGDSTDPSATGMAQCVSVDGCTDCEPTYSDNTSGLTGCPGTGTVIRTWTCTCLDSGAFTTCDQTITIRDSTKPTIDCPDDITVDAPAGSCCAEVPFEVTANDTCDPDPTIHCDHDSGDCFPVGSTPVTCTAADDCGNTSDPCQFSVIVTGTICGMKFYDANVNGLDDDGEVVPGWKVQLKNGDGMVLQETLTGSDGMYCFAVLPETYTVCEVLPSTGNWQASTPTCVSVTVTPELCRGAANFGNYCTQAMGEGRTLGFWSNKNGKAVLCSHNPEWRNTLNALCLRDATGESYDVPALSCGIAYQSFRTWLLDANAVNMACMLSAQLAATKMNIAYKGLNSGNNVVLPPALAACYGSTTANVGAVVAAAEAALCADGYTPSDDTNRNSQECLKNICDGINNNALPIVLGDPCAVAYP